MPSPSWAWAAFFCEDPEAPEPMARASVKVAADAACIKSGGQRTLFQE